MKWLTRIAALRRARKARAGKGSRLTPAGQVALARGTRTGNGYLAGLGTFMLIVGAARRRSKKGQLLYRRRLRPGKAIRIAVTREGDVVDWT